MRRVLTLALAAALVALVAAGCGSSKKTSSNPSSPATTTTTAKPVGAPGAKVKFVAPKDGGTVAGTTVKVKVKLSGFKIAPQAVGKPPMQGEGHLHFSMDGGKFDHPKYSGPNGQLAVKLGVDGKYSPSVTPTITYKGLPKGKHVLEVYLANNDHSNTGVEAKTSFTIQ